MKRVYSVVLFFGVALIIGTITFVLSNSNLFGKDQTLDRDVQRMDQVLAEDLSLTTSMFVKQLEQQLERWSENDLSDPALRQNFEEEIKEHQHFHAFAIVENGTVKESVGNITEEKLSKIPAKQEKTIFSVPYTENSKQYMLMKKRMEGNKEVVGEIDLSFVKAFVSDLADIADSEGNFFISGKNPEASLKNKGTEAIPSDAATQTVPELGWKVVVASDQQKLQKIDLHYHEGEAVVKFSDKTDAQQLADEHPGITVVKKGEPYFVLRSDRLTTHELLSLLRKDDRIEFAEPNYVFTKQQTETLPNDEFFAPYQWNLSQISSEQGWEIEKENPDVTIAIIDTGVDPEHLDLKGKLLPGFNAFDGSNNSYDEHGHGTHVAGIAAAATNNVTGIAGVSWYSNIMPIKVLDGNGEGTSHEVAEGIRWATDNGADVINMSLGDYYSSFILHDAIQYAYNNDVVLIAAAGNDNVDTPMYPAEYPEVLTVAAVNEHRERAFFSNFGDHVDVSAPGEHIPSTFPNNNYVIMSGTSMAAPHVAGLAGLIRSVNPDLSNKQVYDIIKASTIDLGPKGKDQHYGYGEIDIAKAMEQMNIQETQIEIEEPIKKKRFFFPWQR